MCARKASEARRRCVWINYTPMFLANVIVNYTPLSDLYSSLNRPKKKSSRQMLITFPYSSWPKPHAHSSTNTSRLCQSRAPGRPQEAKRDSGLSRVPAREVKCKGTARFETKNATNNTQLSRPGWNLLSTEIRNHAWPGFTQAVQQAAAKTTDCIRFRFPLREGLDRKAIKRLPLWSCEMEKRINVAPFLI